MKQTYGFKHLSGLVSAALVLGVSALGSAGAIAVPGGTPPFGTTVISAADVTGHCFFSFTDGVNMGDVVVGTTIIGTDTVAVVGSVNITAGADIGTYSLYANPSPPTVVSSPSGAFVYNNVLYPGDPILDVYGLLFTGGGLEINIWGNSPGNYSFWSHNAGGYNVSSDAVSITKTPEPTSLAFALIGGSALMATRLKRRKK